MPRIIFPPPAPPFSWPPPPRVTKQCCLTWGSLAILEFNVPGEFTVTNGNAFTPPITDKNCDAGEVSPEVTAKGEDNDVTLKYKTDDSVYIYRIEIRKSCDPANSCESMAAHRFGRGEHDK